MTATPVHVEDKLFSDLRRIFSEAQLVELTAAIAWENYRARFNHAFGLESEGFSDGAACWLPPVPQRPEAGILRPPGGLSRASALRGAL